MPELDVGFETEGAELLDDDAALPDDVLSPEDLDSAGFDSLFDSVFDSPLDSLDDSDAAFSELALEEDFGA